MTLVVSSSLENDPYQLHRFQVLLMNGPGVFPNPFSIEAGFNACSLPEQTVDEIDYAEGIFTYTQKYPGRSTFSTITLSRGLTKGYSYFASWMRKVSEGRNYRVDLKIREFHRSDVSGLVDYRNARASREILIYEAWPVRYKPGGDHDASSSDISITELDICYERFVVFENGQEVRP